MLSPSNQRLFTDISIQIERTVGSTAFLIIKLKELPRLSRYSITGASKAHVEDIRKDLDLMLGEFSES